MLKNIKIKYVLEKLMANGIKQLKTEYYFQRLLILGKLSILEFFLLLFNPNILLTQTGYIDGISKFYN